MAKVCENSGNFAIAESMHQLLTLRPDHNVYVLLMKFSGKLTVDLCFLEDLIQIQAVQPFHKGYQV